MSDNPGGKQEANRVSAADAPQAYASSSDRNDGESGRHSMNYMVEFLLDDDNYVHRTTVHHVQSSQEESWDNWDQNRLLIFFKRRPELKLNEFTQSTRNIKSRQHERSSEHSATNISGAPSSALTTNETKTRSVEKQSPDAKPLLRKMEIISPLSRVPSRSVNHNHGFNVRLHLNHSEIRSWGEGPIDYIVSILAKSMGGECRQSFIKDRGIITPDKNAILDLKWPDLAPGVYRISAALTLSAKGAEESQPHYDLTSSLEGGLLQVY